MDPFTETRLSLARARASRTVVFPELESAKVEEGGSDRPLHRILLVEDDATLRETLSVGLQRSAYDVSSAGDGEEGWDALCAVPFDALITDNEMPRLTGLDLLRRMRARPLGIPVILTSGNLPWDEPDLPKLLVPGAALAKPFLLVALLAKLRELLGLDPDGRTRGAPWERPPGPSSRWIGIG
jgi:CheY-like chemotaxis protein